MPFSGLPFQITGRHGSFTPLFRLSLSRSWQQFLKQLPAILSANLVSCIDSLKLYLEDMLIK